MNDTNIKTFKNYFKSQIAYLGYENNGEYESNIIEYCMKMHYGSRIYKMIWLVEGKTDVAFYGNINTQLSKDSLFVFVVPSTYFKQLVGKQNVLSSYMTIKNHDQLSRNMNKYIFMVDHDYDGIDYYQPDIHSRYEPFLDKDKRNISVTEGYSFENYITTKENIEKIFEIVCSLKGLNKDEEIIKFNNKYEKFKEEINLFFSWFACIVYATKNNYFKHYPDLTKVDDIFKYDFSSEKIYNKELLDKALHERKNIVDKNTEHLPKEFIDKLKNVQKQYYNKIIEENYIQGHTLYNFIKEYFYYYFKFNLEINLENKIFTDKILKSLNINFNITLGNGKVIKESSNL